MAEPRPGRFLLARAGKDWFWQPEPNMPVVRIDRAPAHPAPLLSHPVILLHKNIRFCRWRRSSAACLGRARGQVPGGAVRCVGWQETWS
jgi:hypothetical protein